jgi:hypothetical protein
MVRDEAQRNKHEQDVYPGAKKEKHEGPDPPRLVIRDSEQVYDSLLVRGSVYKAVSTVAILQEGRPVGRRHVEM